MTPREQHAAWITVFAFFAGAMLVTSIQLAHDGYAWLPLFNGMVTILAAVFAVYGVLTID